MPDSILVTLQEKRALSPSKTPMKQGEYDLRGGVPIIEIPRAKGGQTDFIVYDNVTSPDGKILIQGTGNAYYGSIRDGDIHYEVRNIVLGPMAFGVIDRYPSDYYLANREFVDSLESRLGR